MTSAAPNRETLPAAISAELSLDEQLRIMDVARALRKERDVAAAQFNREEVRAIIRQRLMASTEITGDTLNEADVDAAIELYFNNLHTYRDPPWSLSLLLAHLYVRRLQVAAGLAVVAALLWQLFR
ncbi:MAG: hypothetical protein KF774_02900 [Planctomyces sp.]|nr:hypothetical protein [Planctomyces sp.]